MYTQYLIYIYCSYTSNNDAFIRKVGDQILEVNGISFLGIVHSDAAHALRAQPCMVLKLKDVGKLPHSRVTTLGKTHWHPTSGSR